ncbi:FAD-dependent oxidoreductase [Amycolatopsis magusensis]|uniref:2-polyprenyl-6-methoxyphenol hydroxylase-like FAD-dependent oxidoreductase n=1 Tax=Amycolatopsis magusensis TaxID=882444 RepID=A0ABS4Q0Q9_9PSEU|nr:FAD-dependent oxidoreductase [Amycolatopsis magusensis]MBP2185247.1 2-polyprenyl-6-methoxyphenol hydroxylase-like FAD-dependent oxidoreductase [Amycolatopsis magusensis]
MTVRIAVVGGGIGGLACALRLNQSDLDVTVFERRPRIEGRGTALGMWPDALRALDAIGLGERVRRTGVAQQEMRFRRSDGRTLARLDVGRLERRTGELPVLISRAALITLLRDALPPERVRTGRPVEPADVEELRAEYDVVIGADGIGSAVRTARFGAGHQPRYSGYSAWIGMVPSEGETSQEIFGRGRKFGVTPAEGGMTNWYAPIRVPQGGLAADPMVQLRELFGDWCDPVPSLIERSAGTEILNYPIRYLAPGLPSLVSGNAVLIGDAAHLMTADLGQGACQALVDGVALGGHLAGGGELVRALHQFDRDRRRPAQRVATAARWLGEFTSRPGLSTVRDLTFRAAGLFGPQDPRPSRGAKTVSASASDGGLRTK